MYVILITVSSSALLTCGNQLIGTPNPNTHDACHRIEQILAEKGSHQIRSHQASVPNQFRHIFLLQSVCFAEKNSK